MLKNTLMLGSRFGVVAHPGDRFLIAYSNWLVKRREASRRDGAKGEWFLKSFNFGALEEGGGSRLFLGRML
jgi:hypothetical protein